MFHDLAILLYLAAFVLWVRSLLSGSRGRGHVVASLAAAAGVGAHAAALTGFWLRWGELPLVGLGPALSTLGLVVGLGLLTLAVMGEPARIGIVLLPFMVLLEGVALIIGVEPSSGVPGFRGVLFDLHVFLAFVGYSGMAVAFSAGLLYLIQFHELKSKRLGRLFRFIPPLATLDRIGRVALWAGFVSLTVALVLGWTWTVRVQDSLPLTDPKIVWGTASWAVFILALAVRVGGGRGERRSALASVWGFGLVVSSYVVIRLTMGGGSFL